MNLHAPKSLRIGPFDYSIEWLDAAAEAEKQRFGECLRDTQIIRIAKNHKRQRIAITFWHEAAHAMWHAYGTGCDPKNEEDMVLAIGFGMSAFIRDNPEAVAWVNELSQNRPSEPFMRCEASQ